MTPELRAAVQANPEHADTVAGLLLQAGEQAHADESYRSVLYAGLAGALTCDRDDLPPGLDPGLRAAVAAVAAVRPAVVQAVVVELLALGGLPALLAAELAGALRAVTSELFDDLAALAEAEHVPTDWTEGDTP